MENGGLLAEFQHRRALLGCCPLIAAPLAAASHRVRPTCCQRRHDQNINELWEKQRPESRRVKSKPATHLRYLWSPLKWQINWVWFLKKTGVIILYFLQEWSDQLASWWPQTQSLSLSLNRYVPLGERRSEKQDNSRGGGWWWRVEGCVRL